MNYLLYFKEIISNNCKQINKVAIVGCNLRNADYNNSVTIKKNYNAIPLVLIPIICN